MIGIAKFSIKAFLTLAIFAVILHMAGFSYVNDNHMLFASFNMYSFFLITTIFILNFYLVALRIYFCYRQFKVHISYSTAKTALLASQASAIIPVFGAALGQSAVVRNLHKISSTTSSFIFFYDKIIMAASGVLISLGAGYYAFGNTYPLRNIEGNVSFIEFVIGLTFTTFVVAIKGISRRDKIILRKYVSIRNLTYVIIGFLLSFGTWILSASCFLLCIYCANFDHAMQINYLQLFCASMIVSFVASMPFSVNGWGIREFAAITFFGLLAIPKEIALSSALSVGIFSTLSLFIVGLAVYLAKQQSSWRAIDSISK